MSNRSFLSFFPLLLLLGLFQTASDDVRQQLKEDLQKIGDAYSDASQHHLKLTYKVYPDHTTTAASEVKYGEVKRSGNNMLFKLGPVTTIQNSKVAIVVDKDRKVLVVTSPKPVSASSALQIPIDSLMLLYSEIEALPNAGEIKGYRVMMPHSTYEKADIYFNRSSYLLNKMVMYYPDRSRKNSETRPEKPRLEILINNILNETRFSDEVFSEKPYITLEGGTAMPSAAYSTYTFINQLSNRK